MSDLSRRQQQILNYIQKCQQTDGFSPSVRDIAAHFNFSSPSTVSEHLAALRKKGALTFESGKARSLRIISPLQSLRKRVVDIPIYGSIPAGFAEDKEQAPEGCLSLDVGTLGFKPSPGTFALRVHGDSMIERLIYDGDTVVVEQNEIPKNGDIVAALIDGESTLKTLIIRNGKSFLKAGNPRYPDLIPVGELVIQGVAKFVLRKLGE